MRGQYLKLIGVLWEDISDRRELMYEIFDKFLGKINLKQILSLYNLFWVIHREGENG
jgi:hypothetical protein